jgi:hypothetical protein
MPALITLRMKVNGELVPAYLADGSEDPIIWTNPDVAMAWAYNNKHLFEREPGAVINRGRFGLIENRRPWDSLDSREPCVPLDRYYIQVGDELINDRGQKISLLADVEAWRASSAARLKESAT